MSILHTLLVEPWPWWLGGIAIGLLVPLMYFFLNTALGVSTGYGNLVKLFLPRSKLKWLHTATYANVFNWRFYFIAGMILGGFLSARFSGGALLTSEMGLFTENVRWPFVGYVLWFLSGGILLGFGSRVAGGCTSGHSIHGIANLHPSSILSTIFFLLFGTIGVAFIRMLLMGGVS
jgi:uncharacterized membrane protein YedE/YeeE